MNVHRLAKLVCAPVQLADAGFLVFPCHDPSPGTPGGCSCGRPDCSSPAKHPRTARGCLDATRDVGVIEGWWTRCPEANVGVATGRESGVWVLDLDGSEGLDSFVDLQAEHGKVARTPTVATASGFHLYFAWLEGVEIGNRTKVRPGVDVRGEHGYVIAPPSVHITGVIYSWARGHSLDDLRPVTAPDWLLELVVRRPEPTPASDLPLPPSLEIGNRPRYVQAAIEAELRAVATAPEGERNDTLNRAAYSLARFIETGEIDAGTIARALAAAAARAGLGEREIRKTLMSALRARGVA